MQWPALCTKIQNMDQGKNLEEVVEKSRETHWDNHKWLEQNKETKSKLSQIRNIAVGMQRQSRRTSPWLIMDMAAVAMSAQEKTNFDHKISFDKDSVPIGVDNRCTDCISHRIEEFEGPMVNSGQQIKDSGGTKTANVQMGTIVWKWHDDKGRTHKFKIPK